MTIKELIKQSGMTQTAFAEYFSIPRRSVQNWCNGVRVCPPYLIELIKYKLEKENII